jgi:hypothetical protein
VSRIQDGPKTWPGKKIDARTSDAILKNLHRIKMGFWKRERC